LYRLFGQAPDHLQSAPCIERVEGRSRPGNRTRWPLSVPTSGRRRPV
jgi:hypothetical protein